MTKTDVSPRLPFSRPLLFLCAGILAATLASAIICQQIIVDSLAQRGDQYGQALANLGARQAIDATLNHDLVSLQVILSDIAENSDVANATIHDVENNLLVQAGSRPRTPSRTDRQWKSYAAPITLHNSIAGYVTVTLDTHASLGVQHQLYWLFGFMAALLLALTLSALYFGRSWNTPIVLPRVALPIVDKPIETTPDSDADEQAAAASAVARSLPRIELVVQFHNLRELQGQLNSQSFRGLAQRLEEHLRGVLTLYGGQLIELNGDRARLGFRSDSDEGAFNALCTAVLLRKLNQQAKGVQLRLSLLLRQRPTDSALLRNLPYELQDSDEFDQLLRESGDNEILLEASLLELGEMGQRAQCEALSPGGDILRVVEIPEPYQSLLSKQLGQLQRR